MEIEKKAKKQIGDIFTGTQVIALGFLAVILVGTLLLMLPCMTRSGEGTAFVDALFMSTTSVCVTGLSLVNIYEYWNIFGQIVILILIQIGGIGVVAMTILLLMIFKKKVTLKDRMLIQESYSANSMAGLVSLTRKILIGIGVVELAGASFYAIQFVPEFGPARGLWISLFMSVSAFCNAGMEVIGGDSLAAYVSNPLVNGVTMGLIILGGIGFFVWWDVIHVIRKWRKTGIKNCFWKLRLHSKIVLTMTAGLIAAGALFVFALEYNNPETLGGLSLLEKMQAALFQSVTTRTAGFATVNQAGLRESTALVSSVLMFIGGSPAGTAGGVKTMTIAMIMASTMSVVRGDKETTVYRRTIPEDTVKKSLAVFTISFAALIMMIIVFSVVQPAPLVDQLYEVISALATVGLSRNLTGALNLGGKLIIILCMYIGRIGPISLIIALRMRGKRKDRLHYAQEDVIVG